MACWKIHHIVRLFSQLWNSICRLLLSATIDDTGGSLQLSSQYSNFWSLQGVVDGNCLSHATAAMPPVLVWSRALLDAWQATQSLLVSVLINVCLALAWVPMCVCVWVCQLKISEGVLFFFLCFVFPLVNPIFIRGICKEYSFFIFGQS
jgi:hypothetical protein